MYNHPPAGSRRLGIGLGMAAGVIAAALAGSPLASADESPLAVDASTLAALGEPPCTADLCTNLVGPYLPYFPFEFAQEVAPATDYSSEGAFYAPNDLDNGLADATGFDIASGHTSLLTELAGVSGETVLYTLNDGIVSAPIELLPFDLPL
jgi:hypothetical protein